jgi:transcriptional regulator with XRE-family HTH domain
MPENPEYVAAEAELKPVLEIANVILRLRLAKGWSQSELARRAGAAQATISKLENGLVGPTLSLLHRVARALETE